MGVLVHFVDQSFIAMKIWSFYIDLDRDRRSYPIVYIVSANETQTSTNERVKQNHVCYKLKGEKKCKTICLRR